MTSSHKLPMDQHGKTLQDYPRPSVAVDTALLTAHDGGLKVLLVRSPGGGWALPGTFVHPGERLADAVLRSLREKAGVSGRSPQQLHVFDEPGRDERGWVLSVAHVDVLPAAELVPAVDQNPVVEPVETPTVEKMLVPVADLAPVADLVPVVELVETLTVEKMPVPVVELVETPTNRTAALSLPYDHAQIIEFAVEQVRSQYRAAPDPGRLLQTPFTLKELRLVHESVLGEALQRDTFRRAMEPQLVATGEMSDGAKGRPAALFRIL